MKNKSSNLRISVGWGMSGYYAVMYVDVMDEQLGTYTDIQQTGIGRYKNKEDAVMEARGWAKSECLPFVD